MKNCRGNHLVPPIENSNSNQIGFCSPKRLILFTIGRVRVSGEKRFRNFRLFRKMIYLLDFDFILSDPCICMYTFLFSLNTGNYVGTIAYEQTYIKSLVFFFLICFRISGHCSISNKLHPGGKGP